MDSGRQDINITKLRGITVRILIYIGLVRNNETGTMEELKFVAEIERLDFIEMAIILCNPK